jgi:cytochrome c oxidase subunit 2
VTSPGHSTLEPASHAAREIARLWWVMMSGAWIGFGVVLLLLLLGWLRRRRRGLPFGADDTAATRLVVALGVAVPVVVLTTLFFWSDVFVIRSTAAPTTGSARLEIRVVGHQWFWEVRYPASGVVTANEIHIPVGERVRVVTTTDDVIHSFWVPALNRKVDMIPGRPTAVLLQADRPGIYRGQCAEFCGLQHAHMSLLVFADPPARFRAWLAASRRASRSPAGTLARRGERVFLAEACSGCHTVRGTDARGTVGPDLTHVGSRVTLAANTLPNDPSTLGEWIRDPQHVKPGAKMPDLVLSEADVRALVAYLRGLR